jgi:nucleotide-binding universal stress UspA family protein
MKYSTILVPLDGSSLAERALPVAARITHSTGGSLVLLQALRASVEFESGAASPALWALPVSPEERETAQRYLASVRQAQIRAETPVQMRIVAGPPAAMILAASVGLGADLIVLASHGRSGMGRWLLGSVAAEVVRDARIPVFVVRESALTGVLTDHGSTPPAGPSPAGQRPLSALVPLDGSPLAEAALRPAVLLLGALTSPAPISLRLLVVVEPLPLTGTAALGRGLAGEGHVALTAADTTMLGEAEEYLCSVKERIQREAAEMAPGCALSVTWAALSGIDVAHTILTVAERGYEAGEGALHATHLPQSDVIAMATHGRGGLRRWVMGGVTNRVLHAAHTPLLIVRPPQGIQTPSEGACNWTN